MASRADTRQRIIFMQAIRGMGRPAPLCRGFKYSRALRSALLGCGEALVRQRRLHAGQQQASLTTVSQQPFWYGHCIFTHQSASVVAHAYIRGCSGNLRNLVRTLKSSQSE